MSLIKIKKLRKSYSSGSTNDWVLDGIDLTIEHGEMIAIVGTSGSGKSTLLNIIAGLDNATEGEYYLENNDMMAISGNEKSKLRNRMFGFIFQSYNLLNYLNSYDNIILPSMYRWCDKDLLNTRVLSLTSSLGLSKVINHMPYQLSGGQQQRVSIARALVNQPKIIVADEPTGALDKKNSIEVINTLNKINKNGTTVIIVTHDEEIAKNCQRIVTINNGKITKDEKSDIHLEKKDRRTLNEMYVKTNFIYRLKKHIINTKKIYINNKLKTCLSLLGIIVGIATIVATMSIANSVRDNILSQFSRLGDEVVQANLNTGGANRTLTPKEFKSLQELNLFKSISPFLTEYITSLNQPTISLYGVNEEFNSIINTKKILGRSINAIDVKDSSPIVVINDVYNEDFFNGEARVGDKISIRGNLFTLVGVLSTSNSIRHHHIIWMPYSTMLNLIKKNINIDTFHFTLKEGITEEETIRILQNLLSNNYNYWSNKEYATTLTNVTNTFRIFIFIIASISLLIAGSGIMNMMLASVNERVTEIGLRLALGAEQENILEQFIIESILITQLGGIIGIITSTSIITLMDTFIPDFTITLSFGSLFIGLSFSILTGLVFGYIPAKKASTLTPVEALSR